MITLRMSPSCYFSFNLYISFRLNCDVTSCVNFQSGSDQGDSQKIVATGVVKKKTLGSPSQRSISVDRRKKAPVLPSEDKIAQQRDIEKFLIKNEFIPLDAQDIYKFEFLDVGDDGHEDVCHMCGLHGKLVCCDRCPISMHFTCTEVLDLRLPKDEEEWYCPICVFTKAAQVAAEANKVSMLSCYNHLFEQCILLLSDFTLLVYCTRGYVMTIV